ncbi:helix-turn-helix domain-containing protein [Streptomyces sp. enrichment culture]|uniref:helix-turn-helix domain-containing protein n=1 Tax=Streptomyces sp. enrichment culture TaxID=1795815 RepID=UPI003F56EFFE
MHLRHGVTHDVLACWFGVDRSALTRPIGEVRPLLAEAGCTVGPGVRLRTLTEVIDHFGADGKTGIIDGNEIRVRRPPDARTVRRSSPAKTSGTPSKPWFSRTATAVCCSAAQPNLEAARTSPTPTSSAGPAPGRRARGRDPRRCRPPGPGRPRPADG